MSEETDQDKSQIIAVVTALLLAARINTHSLSKSDMVNEVGACVDAAKEILRQSGVK